jgi:hypothetical protein
MKKRLDAKSAKTARSDKRFLSEVVIKKFPFTWLTGAPEGAVTGKFPDPGRGEDAPRQCPWGRAEHAVISIPTRQMGRGLLPPPNDVTEP